MERQRYLHRLLVHLRNNQVLMHYHLVTSSDFLLMGVPGIGSLVELEGFYADMATFDS